MGRDSAKSPAPVRPGRIGSDVQHECSPKATLVSSDTRRVSRRSRGGRPSQNPTRLTIRPWTAHPRNRTPASCPSSPGRVAMTRCPCAGRHGQARRGPVPLLLVVLRTTEGTVPVPLPPPSDGFAVAGGKVADTSWPYPRCVRNNKRAAVETVEKLPPICACCREKITGLWMVTSPRGFVVCGDGNCQRWTAAQGERIAVTGVIDARPVARRPRRPARATCDYCKQWLPTARRHQFLDGPRRYCTLTCMNNARTEPASPQPL